MPKLHVYIDGSWLFNACAPHGVLASHMEHDNYPVRLDFSRLNTILLDSAMKNNPECTEIGERYLCMSIFTLPKDFESWPARYTGVSHEDISKTQRSVFARNSFIKSATDAGYSGVWVSRPPIELWSFDKLTGKSGKYQEKCADTSIVFMLGQAIGASPDDLQCVITGDGDLLPPVMLDDPEYTRNLMLATTRPDEARPEHRQSSFRLNKFEFRIPPVYLQDNLVEVVNGKYVSKCCSCRLVFSRTYAPPSYSPLCGECYDRKRYNR